MTTTPRSERTLRSTCNNEEQIRKRSYQSDSAGSSGACQGRPEGDEAGRRRRRFVQEGN
jgi:hypothetical protein